jgi:hypothetical protein
MLIQDRKSLVEAVESILEEKTFNKTDFNNRTIDKEIALRLTDLYFAQLCRMGKEDPIQIFKKYWQELATMV